MTYDPATRPTMYFIGVTTAKSSIMKVFPAWTRHLGLDAVLKGIDFAPNADPAAYRVLGPSPHSALNAGWRSSTPSS